MGMSSHKQFSNSERRETRHPYRNDGRYGPHMRGNLNDDRVLRRTRYGEQHRFEEDRYPRIERRYDRRIERFDDRRGSRYIDRYDDRRSSRFDRYDTRSGRYNDRYESRGSNDRFSRSTGRFDSRKRSFASRVPPAEVMDSQIRRYMQGEKIEVEVNYRPNRRE